MNDTTLYTTRITEDEMMPAESLESRLSETFQAIAAGETTDMITLPMQQYRDLVDSHTHLYLSIGIMNDKMLATKRMIRAAEICELHKNQVQL